MICYKIIRYCACRSPNPLLKLSKIIPLLCLGPRAFWLKLLLYVLSKNEKKKQTKGALNFRKILAVKKWEDSSFFYIGFSASWTLLVYDVFGQKYM